MVDQGKREEERKVGQKETSNRVENPRINKKKLLNIDFNKLHDYRQLLNAKYMIVFSF